MGRLISALEPETRVRAAGFLADCASAGLAVLVTCTDRTFKEQAALYAVGRTIAGRMCRCGGVTRIIGACSKHPLGLRITNARPGLSWHNWLRALDVVPLRYGKPVWGTRGDGIDDDPTDDVSDDLELWQRVAVIGKAHGLEWAGDWHTFPEYPHFQCTGGLSLGTLIAAYPAGLAG